MGSALRRAGPDLSQFGENDAFGEGDYWLVDDDWGGLLHKIVVRNPDFWSDQVQQRFRETLKGFPQWGLFVVFDDHLAKLVEDNGGDSWLADAMEAPTPEEVSKLKVLLERGEREGRRGFTVYVDRIEMEPSAVVRASVRRKQNS